MEKVVQECRLTIDPATRPNRLRSILAGSAGNLVESFDWFAYAAFGLYFSHAFVPDGDRAQASDQRSQLRKPREWTKLVR